MNYDFDRHRRLRSSSVMRDLVRETILTMDDMIYPIFVKESNEPKTEIPSMPGIYQYPLNELAAEIKEVSQLGIKAVLLFGIPNEKDAIGSGAFHTHGIVQEATRVVKQTVPEMLVVADTCLCEYTDHGHCGVIQEGQILNDESLELLKKNSCQSSRSRSRYYCAF